LSVLPQSANNCRSCLSLIAISDPYGPDLNPIEQFLSTLKAMLHKPAALDVLLRKIVPIASGQRF
jgi:transposase